MGARMSVFTRLEWPGLHQTITRSGYEAEADNQLKRIFYLGKTTIIKKKEIRFKYYIYR
jgi:hypothetical protein